jgi:hypothetical protein
MFSTVKELKKIKFFILKQAKTILKEQAVHEYSYQYNSSSAALDYRVNQ